MSARVGNPADHAEGQRNESSTAAKTLRRPRFRRENCHLAVNPVRISVHKRRKDFVRAELSPAESTICWIQFGFSWNILRAASFHVVSKNLRHGRVSPFESWTWCLRSGLALLFLYTASAHWGKRRGSTQPQRHARNEALIIASFIPVHALARWINSVGCFRRVSNTSTPASIRRNVVSIDSTVRVRPGFDLASGLSHRQLLAPNAFIRCSAIPSSRVGVSLSGSISHSECCDRRTSRSPSDPLLTARRDRVMPCLRGFIAELAEPLQNSLAIKNHSLRS